MAIVIDDLAAEVNRQLALYAGATDQVVAKTVDEVADAVVAELRITSPRRTGKYAEAWKPSTPTEGRNRYKRIVNAGKMYRLTHLLELGHKVKPKPVRPGKKDWVDPSPVQGHIKPAEERMIAKFEADLRRNIEAIR